jgi:Helicase conserved C-terminal domain
MSQDNGSAAVLAPPPAEEIRDRLASLVRLDLVGPAGGNFEELPTGTPNRVPPIRDRYPVGCLAPRGTVVHAEEIDGLSDTGDLGGDDDSRDDAPPPTGTFVPSSMGFSFVVDGDERQVIVEATWGRYIRRPAALVREDGGRPDVWAREPSGGELALALAEGLIDPVPVDEAQPEVHVRGRIRRHEGQWVVSLFLVNGQKPVGRYADARWIFQARLSVRGADGSPSPFRRRELPLPPVSPDDPAITEVRALAMRYRGHPEIAVGHGVGVDVLRVGDDPSRASRISTDPMPSYEVPTVGATGAADFPALATLVLDMKDLADLRAERVRAALQPLADAYQGWIGDRERQLDTDPTLAEFKLESQLALAAAGESVRRIRAGIEVLASEPDALTAFRFANRAMWLQRVRSEATRLRRQNQSADIDALVAELDVPAGRSWRLFQLAFVLQCIPALANPRLRAPGGDEDLVDLLWFPTGGGKTEAYLGLAAFTLAIRRLKPSLEGYYAADGVAVLMRYTLRLLTVQQFQRAAALICACDEIRREDERTWGETPFRLGLWVGGAVTPNNTEDSADWVKARRGPKSSGPPRGGRGSPYQLTHCPWCGAELDPARCIEVDMVRRRTVTACPRAGCEFTLRARPGEGLPVVVVDDELYRVLPAFVIATVDKFAQLPWQGAVQALFGKVTSVCTRHGYRTPERRDCDADRHGVVGGHPAATASSCGYLRPPDLIVQDELHLISGPLGSLVGLYETAIDELSTWQNADAPGAPRIRPKIVASTATVRGADAQATRLYTRKLAVFPPPGLDADDSFFARVRPDLPGRRYVGVCAHGRKFKALLIRAYVAALAGAQLLHERYGGGEASDAYMTLVGYFNSLRELGGMRRVVEDDVTSRLYDAEQLGLARRPVPRLEELTSRRTSDEIPRVLARLERRVPAKRDSKDSGVAPVDVVLATNMISVGVDVPRLGLMVTAGQPKSAAEYIQATSRVGRSFPGLVLTAFNWARPRDLSHYETFQQFHATFYRHVEALSVTPFADRALDRGLTAVLVGLVRQEDETFNRNGDAQVMRSQGDHAAPIVEALAQRAALATDGDADVESRVRAAGTDLLERWVREAKVPNRYLGYRPGANMVGLLRRPDEGDWTQWTCPTSLRDVEPGVRLLLNTTIEPLGGDPPYEPPEAPETGGDDAAEAEGVGINDAVEEDES